MKQVHPKVKGLLTLTAVFTIIVMQSAFSQTINNDAAVPNVQTVSEYLGPITNTSSSASEKDIISIFPNPVSDNMTIQSTQPIHFIRIFDMLGRVVKQFQPDQLRVKINLHDLIPGKYFLRIQLTGMYTNFVSPFVKV